MSVLNFAIAANGNAAADSARNDRRVTPLLTSVIAVLRD
jgi:hypothetical protein